MSKTNLTDGELRRVYNKINTVTSGGVLGNPLSGGNIWTASVGTKFSGNLVNQINNPELNSIAAVYEDLKSQGISLNGSKLIPLVTRMQRERVSYATYEFLQSWDKEKLLENYLWNNIIEPRISSLTAATRTKEFLQKQHYFGLVVSKDFAPLEPRTIDGVYNGADPIKYARFVKRYQYKVGVDFGKDFGSKYGFSKMVFEGGSQF